MDDMGHEVARPQPARQPEAVPPGLVGNRDARDRAAGPDGLLPPALQQAQQRLGIWPQFLQRVALDAGTIAPTSQLAWLISITAINVLSWSRAVRDRLKSLGCGIGVLHRVFPATTVPSPRRPPILS
jgi:hypothetical protein